MSKSARGPPPGLGSNKVGGNGSTAGTNGWIGSGLTGRMSNSSNWAVNNSAGWTSTWLLLKNLTAQVCYFITKEIIYQFINCCI